MFFILSGLLSIEFPYTELYQTSIEEVPEGGVFDQNINVVCIDGMGQPVPTARYRITSGNSGPFQVNPMSGSIEVSTGETVDYEEGRDFYNFTVECYDTANPDCRDTVLVNITILPVNEYLPVINISIVSVNVTETIEIGTTVFSTVPPSLYIFTAIDRDRGEHGRINYSLSTVSSSKLNNDFFNINSTTGALTLARSLDIESNLELIANNTGLITIRVTACDRVENVELCPTFVVNLLVYAVNEFYPRFSQKMYTASVSESTEVGVNIIQLNCTDKDRGRGSFERITLEREDQELTTNSSFSLTDNNVVTLVTPLDFEESRLYNITLICYDNDGRNDTAYLLINITAVNDHKPHFTEDHYDFTLRRISKIGTEIGRVVAVDDDENVGGHVTYHLSSDSSRFGIRLDGVIYLEDDIYIVESNNFSFSVTATDGEYNDTAQVNVTVVGFLNVTEIAILATAVVVFFLIILCSCLFCILNRKRLVKWYNKNMAIKGFPTASILCILFLAILNN